MTGNWRKILKLIWRDEWAKEGGRKSEWKEQDPALQAVKCVKAQEGINLPKTRTRKLSLQQSFEWISFHLLSLEGKITTSFEMYQVSHKAERNRRWEASLPDLGTALPHSSRDAWVILHSCVTLKTIMLFVVWEKKNILDKNEELCLSLNMRSFWGVLLWGKRDHLFVFSKSQQ